MVASTFAGSSPGGWGHPCSCMTASRINGGEGFFSFSQGVHSLKEQKIVSYKPM